jgi:hypothetical protein
MPNERAIPSRDPRSGKRMESKRGKKRPIARIRRRTRLRLLGRYTPDLLSDGSRHCRWIDSLDGRGRASRRLAHSELQ